MEHVAGSETTAHIFLDASSTGCVFSDGANGFQSTYESIPSSVLTGTFNKTIPVSRKFSVPAAGTYTFYLNGIGTSNTMFWYSGMQAMYFPN